MDLKLRGPGDFFGARQHGLPEMHIADLATDMDVLRRAQQAAADILRRDRNLGGPENKALQKRIRELFELNADAFK
jgi:ATP-dependent DNA helicase RecG